MANTIRNLPTTYDQALARLGGRQVLTIANNTQLRRSGPQAGCDIALTLHGHEVVTFRANGNIHLDSCGYRTVTTKQRLNGVLVPHGSRIVSERGEWQIIGLHGVRIGAFFDGCMFTPGRNAEVR